MPTEDTKKSKATASSFKLTSFVLLAIAIFVLLAFTAQRFLFRQTLYMQAISLIKADKANLALPLLEKMAREHPDNASLYPWLALAYLSNERVAEGRIALDTALKMGLPAADVIHAVNAYSNFYQQRGDYEEAEKLLVSASSNCPAQILNDSRATLYLNWAETNFDENNVEEGVNHLEAAKNNSTYVHEPLHSMIPRRLAEGYKRLAAISEASSNDDKAAFWLEKSLAVIDDSSARTSLGQIYARLNQTQKAIENYLNCT